MPQVHRSAVTHHRAQQLYEIVDDVDQYHLFVPWCTKSLAFERDERSVKGQLTFSAAGIEQSFTTKNLLQPHKTITLTLVDGPFKQLEGCWQFADVNDQQCQVTLDMSFEFSSRLLAAMFSPLLEQVACRLVDAFITRASSIHGAA